MGAAGSAIRTRGAILVSAAVAAALGGGLALASGAAAPSHAIGVSAVTTVIPYRVDLVAPGPAGPGQSAGRPATPGGPKPAQPVPGQVWPGRASADSKPPDVQVAASAGQLLEIDQDQVEVYDRTAARHVPFAATTPAAFFGTPPGWNVSDPRLTFDGASGRWFASALAWSLSPPPNPPVYTSTVLVSVSQGADASQGWEVYQVSTSSSLLCDRPRLGLASDKVVVVCDDRQAVSPLPTSQFVDEAAWVLTRDDLVAGGPARQVSVDLGGRFGVVPALSLGTTTVEYLVYDDADRALVEDQPGPTVGILAMTGMPGGPPVQLTEAHLPTTATNAPPGALQKGSKALVETGDDRLQSAVWQNGVLWTGGNDSCVPAGDSMPRSCLHLLQVGTAGTVPAVTQSFDAGSRQAYLYDPALTLDSAGDLFCLYGSSSSASDIGLWLAGQPVEGPAGSLTGATGLLRSSTAYSGSWGHYAGAAIDPDGGHVWLAGAVPVDLGHWRPQIFEAVETPVLTGITPASGPRSGGQPVTISGRHLLPGAQVLFGKTPATGVQEVDATRITAVTPAERAGTVAVRLRYPDGITSLPAGGLSYRFA